MKLFILTLASFLLVFTSCNEKGSTSIAQAADYEQYLSPDQNPNALTAKKELDFWTKKYNESPSQYPYQAKMAGANSALFGQTGDVNFLNNAYNLYQEINKKTNNTQPGYLRSLARNCISQHKFREAYTALKIAEEKGDQLRSTQKMLFDVCLEFGNKEEAKSYLEKIAAKKDFDYTIRLAKWNDHEGNLDKTIELMEQALADAQEKKNKSLILWSVTNLGDYYGHAGRISDSYQQYLNALSIDPNNSYALKGISWIAFSKDRNTKEAKRILQALQSRRANPDYDLLLAEIAAYEKDTELENQHIAAFIDKTKDEKYGDMYNTYLAEIAESPEAIKSIAEIEINNRPTPQSYALLAWSYYKDNNYKKALEIIENHVQDKTFEPAAQYKMAVVYKANDFNDRVEALKAELGGSSYELGPVMEEKIGSL